MVDQFIGLLLLGLGIQATPFDRYNPNVKGDETVAEETASDEVEVEDSDSQKSKSEAIKEQREAAKKAREEERERIKESFQQEREEAKASMEARREEAKETREASRAAFKANISAIKDARKVALLEKISEKCQSINEKRTDRMNEMLTKMSSILENVANRAATAKTNGKDVTAVETAITDAKTAIATASTAVAAQAGVVCTISVDSETTAKNDVGKTISGLNSELRLIHEKVLAAKKAVGAAIRTLAQVLGESLTPKVTPTP